MRTATISIVYQQSANHVLGIPLNSTRDRNMTVAYRHNSVGRPAACAQSAPLFY